MSGKNDENIVTAASSATRQRGASRNGAILVTGAGGEMGHGLLEALAGEREARIARGGCSPAVVAIGRRELPAGHRGRGGECVAGGVCVAPPL